MTKEAWLEIARDDIVITQRLEGSEQYRFLSAVDGETVIAFFKFQEGKPEDGVNGITYESLLEVTLSRLKEVNESEIDHVESSRAFDLISDGRDELYSRLQRHKEEDDLQA